MMPARWLAAVFVLLTLMGCAGGAGDYVTGSGRDLVTESDEPQARKRARVRLQLAAGYFEQGQNTVALDEAKQAIAIDPTFVAAYNLRGLIYMRLNEMRLAEESFQQGLRVNPRDPDTLHNLGWMRCQEEKYSEASQLFTRALAVPNYAAAARTWMAQGVCQARAGQFSEAEASFTRSFELDPAQPVTNYNLAVLLNKRGESERARYFVRRVNTSDFANAESLWLGIKIENRLRNHEAARQLGEQLRRRFPESREAGAYERGAFNE
ncbi:type IV pilus biogenesis/stability protein PilW [Hydrogenophaga aquatica]